MMMMPDDIIGAIKIKDGLFIGDEFAAQVSQKPNGTCLIVVSYRIWNSLWQTKLLT